MVVVLLLLLLVLPGVASVSASAAAETGADATARTGSSAAQSPSTLVDSSRGAAGRAGKKPATKFVKRWYGVANKRRWKRLDRMSSAGTVAHLRREIRFVKKEYGVSLLPFGKRAKCYPSPYDRGFECYSNNSDPLGVQVQKRKRGWRSVGVQLYD